MAELLIDGLSDDVVARLEAAAARRGISLEALVRETLERHAAQPEDGQALAVLRSMRSATTPDPTWNTVAEIRAEREARTARVLGEDPDEAWARAYQSALQPPAKTEGPRDDAA